VPIAIPMLAGGMAVFWGLAALCYRWINPVGWARAFCFAGVFAATEWLRGHIFTGLPWNLIGTAWTAGSAPSQLASWIGVYGLTWLTILVSCLISLVVVDRSRTIPSALAAICVALLWLPGAIRLHDAGPVFIPRSGETIRMVQANIDQSSKWDPQTFNRTVQTYLSLTKASSSRIPDIIVWPEGALPASANDFLAPGTWTRADIAASLRPGQTLLMGAYRAEAAAQGNVYFNSLLQVERNAQGLLLSAPYDKMHLTPFGEYLPFEDIMSRWGIKSLVHVGDGFTAGQRHNRLQVGNTVLQPLICYESLFPDLLQAAIKQPGQRPDALLNISNDAWFGTSWGPVQNFNLSAYRTIESGIPMLRVTPTGITAVIDAFGRSSEKIIIPQKKQGFIDTFIPLSTPTTVFTKYGNGFFCFFLLTSLIATLGTPFRVSSAFKRTTPH